MIILTYLHIECPALKERLSGEKVKFLEHFFWPIHFLVFFSRYKLKINRKVIKLDYQPQISWFFTLWSFVLQKPWENEKWPKKGQKTPKVKFFGFQTWFTIIFIPQIHQNVIFGIFANFRTFFVIFGLPTSGPNPSGRDQKNSTFFAWIH